MTWAPPGQSYTRDREARRARLKERGHDTLIETGRVGVKKDDLRCQVCADTGQRVSQDEGRLVPCPRGCGRPAP